MTLKVHHLRPAPGAKTAKTRVGRGEAGKRGKTAGRGTKGTKARYQVPARFEGGQMPLHMRVPKLKGFNNPFRVEYQAINLHALNDLAESLGQSDITLDDLVASGLLTKGDFAKILARGEITAKVNVQAHGASAAAVSAIEAAGGSVTLITLPFMEEGKAGRPASQGNQFMNR